MYYLNARYYNPEWERFISADSEGLLSATMGSYNNKNLFAYCDANPVCRTDETGRFWNKIVSFFKKIFGAGHTKEQKFSIIDSCFPHILSPISVSWGKNTTTKVSSVGDSSKPISVYSQDINGNPVQSSVGIKINSKKESVKINLSLSNVGVSHSLSFDNVMHGIQLSASLTDATISLRYNQTSILLDGTTDTNYYQLNVSAWWLLAIAYYAQTGQVAPQPNPA